jgi:hypothetical protein
METSKDLTFTQAHWMLKYWARQPRHNEYAARQACAWWYISESIRYDSQLLRSIAELMLLV